MMTNTKHPLTPELKDALLAKGVPMSTIYDWAKAGVPDRAVICKKWGWTDELSEIRSFLSIEIINAAQFTEGNRHLAAKITGGVLSRLHLHEYGLIEQAIEAFRDDLKEAIQQGTSQSLSSFIMRPEIRSRALLREIDESDKLYYRIQKEFDLSQKEVEDIKELLEKTFGIS